MNAVLERTGGFASTFGRFARDGAVGLVRAAQARAAEQSARRDAEHTAFADAIAKAKAFAVAAYAEYQPEITQAQVDAVSWETPIAVEDLLGAECDRIRAKIKPLLRAAGFPLDSKDQLLRDQMNEVFYELLRPAHKKAFGDLRLPPFFAFRNGLIEFEDTYKSSIKSTYLYPYVGAVSGYRYIDNRYMPDPPTLGFY